MIKKLFIPQTPEERKKKRKHILLAVLSGVLLGLSFPPISFNFLMFVAFIPLFFVFQERNGLAEISRIMYLAMFVWTLITLYWVGSWQPEADPFLMISGVLLMFANPAVYLIPSTLFYFAQKSFNKQIAFLVLPFFWVAWEYVFSIIDIKFPWLMLSNSQTNYNSYIQIADIIGAYGISLFILFINVFAFLFMKERKGGVKNFKRYFYLIIMHVFIIGPIIYGNIKLSSYQESNEKLKVGLIQPDINPWKKWQSGNLNQQIDSLFDMSEKALSDGAQIIIWPETALPVYLLSGNYPVQLGLIHKFVDSNNVVLLTGMPHATFYQKDDKDIPDFAKPLKSGNFYTSYNSSLAFQPGSTRIQQYGKIKLVPFGERIPWLGLIPFLGDIFKWNVGISSWNIGRDTTVFDLSLNDKQFKAAAVVCIESIYPDFIARFAEKGAGFIAVVTNDSWYGNSSGPYQHKETSVLRAIENRKYVVQAANGGISYLIDPLGNFVNQSKMFEKTVLTGEVSLEYDTTFFTRNPLLLVYFSLIVSIAFILIFYIRKIKIKLKLK